MAHSEFVIGKSNMIQVVICLLLSYVSLVASLMGAGSAAAVLALSAVVIVLVVRWFSPGMAAAWGFALGVMLDSLGGGPLGVHAAIFVLLTALLPRFGFAREQTSAWRWLWAVFLTAWCDGAITAVVELLPHHQTDALEQRLIACVIASAVTATVMGLWVGTWRVITRA